MYVYSLSVVERRRHDVCLGILSSIFTVELVSFVSLFGRNRVAAREEEVKIKEEEMNTAIAEKRAELERMSVELDSLRRLQQEQELLIARLSSAQDH